MREIKFRAWDIRNEVMWLRKPKQLTSEFFQLIEQDTEGGEQFILMQYTDLKDKNGVEIYEGDLLKWHWLPIGKTEAIEHTYSVIFQDGQFQQYEQGDPISSLWKPWDELEVIGNIYENKELIK